MKLVTTTGDFECFTFDEFERIKCLYDAGFRYIDLSLYTIYPGNKFFEDGFREFTLEIKKYAEDLGMIFLQAHSPNTNNLASEEGYKDAVWKTIRSIEICGLLGIPNLVVHAGFSTEVTEKDVWFEENRKFFRELFPYMEKYNVNVLCENSTKKNMGSRYYLISGKDTREFCKFVNHPLFHACWDTGHANCEGNQYDEILDLGDELYAIHFNDNRGTSDEHLIPFMGTLNSDEIMSALIDVGFKGPFTLECGSSLRPYNYWLGKRQRFEKEARLREPSIKLQKKAEELLFETGKEILQAYELYEN